MKTKYKWVSALPDNGFLLVDYDKADESITVINTSHWHGSYHWVGETIHINQCMIEKSGNFVPYLDPVDILKEMF